MAQTGGRAGTRATGQRATNATNETATNTATNETGTANAGAGTASSLTSTAMANLGVWRERVGTFLAPKSTATTAGGARGQTTGAATGPQRPSTGKVMLGMLAFVAGAELLLFLVQFLDVRFFKGYLELHYIASRNTPILGGMTWFLLILMVLTLGLWIALNRLGIIQPLTQRPSAQTSAARGKTTTGTTAATAGRNRAARRLAEANAAASTKGTTKGTTGTAKGGTGKSAAVAAAGNSGRLAGANDATYQRVKAAQRSRKRRAGKR